MIPSGLAGKSVLVTGGSRGIGRAIVELFADEGANVTFFYRGNTDAAEDVVAKMRAIGHDVHAEQVDVVHSAGCNAAVERLADRVERIDVLVNNAGVDVTRPIEEIAVAEWDRILGVNLRGPFMLSRLAFSAMRRQGSGQIVNVVSTAAKRAWANASAYHASKWGLLGLSHALHVEGRAVGIGVTAVIAGGMRTPFLFDRFPDLDPDLLQEPASVANAVRFVLSQPAGTVVPELTVLPLRETSWP
jgi:NAD(P)-dependent dehydrogenase (short-subunit alcohol dehydrogenase family)